MRWLIVRFLISAVVMAIVTSGLLPGVYIAGRFAPTWIAISVIFAIINLTIKPVLQFLTCPLIVITLGLIGVLINVLMLYITVWVSGLLISTTGGEFHIDTFLSGLIAALIITAATIVLEWVFGAKRHDVRVKKVTEVRYVVEKQRPQLDADFERQISSSAPQYPPQSAPPPSYPAQNAPPQYTQPTPPPPQYPPQQQTPPPAQIPPQYPPGTFGSQPPAPPRKSGTPDDWDFDDPAFPRKK